MIEMFKEDPAREKQFCFVAFLTEILTDHFEGSLPLHLPQLSQRQNPLYRNDAFAMCFLLHCLTPKSPDSPPMTSPGNP